GLLPLFRALDRLPKYSVLDQPMIKASRDEWLDLIMRSVGLEPTTLSHRIKLHYIARLAPLVEPNYNYIELGPRGTGKSYFFSEFSPYATLISGGQATKATLFYNNARRKVGLVGYWDTVAFDEVGGIKIRDPDTIQIMKDFMANGRFSRGVEVIADASLSFVGNIDLSVQQVVNSTEYDLFQPLPVELDLAVMDRFAAYIPGWEMPKNSSEFLTDRYGFITDYLAEAFHYQFSHTNRYEEVSKRIRLGQAIEGRDEKGIKKTVCAFLKILHPDGAPSDTEFEEYVAYAIECRRRVKEQMNKRKPDDEFARIGLSYLRSDDSEVVVYCPESKDALATQQPARRRLANRQGEVGHDSGASIPGDEHKGVGAPSSASSEVEAGTSSNPAGEGSTPIDPGVLEGPQPSERHFTILYDDTGHTYESIMGPYLRGARAVVIEEPYIRAPHQIHNFVRFCETLLKAGTIKQVTLITSYDDTAQLKDVAEKLEDLKQSLLELDVVLDVQLNPNLHDREIRIDNGWVVKIGRGLDIYQKPNSWFEVGANDLSLRKCLETKVDIFRA
ncbi:BREX system Lon protease-like protein BrxL, partial [Thiorhodococcus minor]